MSGEIGHYALLLALVSALLQGTLPLIGASRGVALWMDVATAAARTQFVFLASAFLALVSAFVQHDFSLLYVALHSNTALPLYYRISATWGAHEGSMLLWALILSGWGFAVSVFSKELPPALKARVLGIMGLISVGILLFIELTSNPFERVVPMPVEGQDLNPLLQDFGMTIHPPMLYMGYVGLAVAFSFAIAALLGGGLDAAWSRWSRPWTLIAWIFLTFGIVLGSWWAYYELGWGGWWFWDPVENASFMPWLMATALLHSLAVTEKRGAFKAWTVLLAIFAFSLSLLGTFLVRSGVLTSVHAFASDPARGLFILVFLALVVGGSLLLYGIKAPRIRDQAQYALFSRETLLLVNNLLLVTAAASILLGTLYPLVLDALQLGKISVGPPYFSRIFTPIVTAILLLAGLGSQVSWHAGDWPALGRKIRRGLLIVLPLTGLLAALASALRDPQTLAGVGLALWLTITQGLALAQRIRGRSSLWEGLRSISRSFLGMTFAHLGLAVFVIGVVVSNGHSEERIVRLGPGDSVAVGPYALRLLGVKPLQGPNFTAQEGDFEILSDHQVIGHLKPQKRVYQVQKNPMTEAAIDPGLTRDLYVALGEPLDDRHWSVRAYHKPMIRWIWLGGLMMMLGGLLSVSDPRYRISQKRQRMKGEGLCAR